MPLPTSFIKRKAGASLLHSVRTAEAIGRPFNTFVTVSLWKLGLTPDDASRFFQELRERHFQRWSSYVPRGDTTPRNGPPTYAWVIEAPRKLAHVHWMVHVRPGQERAFAAVLDRWIVRRTGIAQVPEGVIEIARIDNAEGLKLYFAKGLDPHLARLWRIHPVESGRVHGRRAGTSRNLGPAEWQPRKAAYQRSRRRVAA
ncbi:hypothetical protein [Rhodovulum sulfidophilum]|uniref:Uncharacterized protein n=1 Tax=Rhodovulum sulfidophilum TaxID=35806 RepID=A0ABS1RYK8_RHOSU|nr:hypothetical protein [Rhodovulum sulfidophilum]MBL3611185.1 hypothetical protein [Rhodovulum sulfidophilum]MCE8455728.1 hypothetical protein [Rhodovulum sulfidophilum]